MISRVLGNDEGILRFFSTLYSRNEWHMVERFFSFADDLEALCDRNIELIGNSLFKNSCFRYSVNNSRITIYELEGSEAAA